MPAVPLGEAGRYVAAAYIVFFALVLIYVAIMSIKLSRMERELAELNELADRRVANTSASPSPPRAPEETTRPRPDSAPQRPAPQPPASQAAQPAAPTPTPSTTR